MLDLYVNIITIIYFKKIQREPINNIMRLFIVNVLMAQSTILILVLIAYILLLVETTWPLPDRYLFHRQFRLGYHSSFHSWTCLYLQRQDAKWHFGVHYVPNHFAARLFEL